MNRVTHGGDVYSEENAGAVDFSANINPLGLPQSVKKAVIEAAGDCQRYPDPLCRRLCTALSEYEYVPRDTIFCSNGASEIIYRIAWAVRPRSAILTAPAFSEYRQAVESAGGNIRSYPLREETGFETGEDLLRLIDDSVGLVFICNPNNPTGVPVKRETARKIAGKCRQAGAILVLDECFMDFVIEGETLYSAKPILSEYGNIILLKAFTKIFAMPGIRLGYCISSGPGIIDRLSSCGQPWSVSTFAQAAGIAAAGEKRFTDETRAYVEKERNFLKRALEACGFKVFDSKANFVFFRARHNFYLKENLLRKGFLIRSCADFDGLDGSYYRVAVRTHDENRALIKAVEDTL
jgi:threonine-phosphate decarboxylase